MPYADVPDFIRELRCCVSVGLLALNTGNAAQSLKVSDKATAWVMTGQPINTRAVKVNGAEPSLDAKGELKGLEGVAAMCNLAVPAQSIAFVAVADANKAACS